MPIPSAHTLSVQTLKDEDLATLFVFDKHADVIVLGARDTTDNAVLHSLACEK